MHTLRNLKRAFLYSKGEKKNIILYLFFSFFMAIIGVLAPILTARELVFLTNSLLIQVIGVATIIFVVEILRNIFNYYTSKTGQIIFRETQIKLQKDLADNILDMETKEFDNNSSGVFIQRLTGDVSKISDVFVELMDYSSLIISKIGMLFSIFIINKIIFLYLIISLIIIFTVERLRLKNVNERDKVLRKEQEKLSGFTGELVRGSRDIKMLNAEDSFIENIYNKIQDVNKKRYQMSSVSRKFRFVRGSLMDISDLFITILLCLFISKNIVSIPNAIIVHNFSGQVQNIIHNISRLLDALRDFNLSSKRVYDVIDNEEFAKEKFGTKHLKKVHGDFEFKNVSFKYKDEYVLKNLSFKVNANETTAFVGKSGAGKTTIFNLLCKMYDVSDGEILIDGMNIKELDKDSIRGNITIISQNPYIFHMTIRENLELVKKNVTDKEIKKACNLACLDDFIETLPDKYDTIIGEGGVNLSGGQRQRLAIARALIQKTEIILFDEATSALDNETQKKIQEAINNLKKDYTILIIAHRLSTIVDADRVLYIEDGKILDEGTHQELLKKNKNYKKLYEMENFER